MASSHSIDFFSRQFEQQLQAGDRALNPFEQAVLPHLAGEVLDLGCGLGNLARALAARGQRVTAIDASAVAVAHLRQLAAGEGLPLVAQQADLRHFRIGRVYDSIVSIGLLMFFDCASATRLLDDIRAHVAPGGVAAVNVLVGGTTYLAMFGADPYCLFEPGALAASFDGWQLLHAETSRYPAPEGRTKAFETVIARRA